jgi:hypothetical protein
MKWKNLKMYLKMAYTNVLSILPAQHFCMVYKNEVSFKRGRNK